MLILSNAKNFQCCSSKRGKLQVKDRRKRSFIKIKQKIVDFSLVAKFWACKLFSSPSISLSISNENVVAVKVSKNEGKEELTFLTKIKLSALKNHKNYFKRLFWPTLRNKQCNSHNISSQNYTVWGSYYQFLYCVDRFSALYNWCWERFVYRVCWLHLDK